MMPRSPHGCPRSMHVPCPVRVHEGSLTPCALPPLPFHGAGCLLTAATLCSCECGVAALLRQGRVGSPGAAAVTVRPLSGCCCAGDPAVACQLWYTNTHLPLCCTCALAVTCADLSGVGPVAVAHLVPCMPTAPCPSCDEHPLSWLPNTPFPLPACREVMDSQWRPSKFTQALAWSQLYTSSVLTLPNAIFTFLAFPAAARRFCECVVFVSGWSAQAFTAGPCAQRSCNHMTL
jgi:hypothetical protein